MAVTKIVSFSNGADKFYTRVSDALYTSGVMTAVGMTAYTPTAGQSVALVSQSELVRCGLCVRLQVRLAGVGGKPPTSTSVIASTEDTGLAMTYFNGATKPTIGSRTVLGANFKRDKFYV
jgi:hypothetical protein